MNQAMKAVIKMYHLLINVYIAKENSDSIRKI